VIPGGVNSPVRSWKAVGGRPLFLQRGRAAEVIDADGRAYLDFLGSWGALILGHAPPRVSAAIAQRAKAGTSFGAPTAGEVELARLLVEAVPSVEQVRLVNSGTEATMSALRLARAATGREAILKFAGCYHGHVDALLVRAGSGPLTLGVPDSPGVPPSVTALTGTAEFNDVTGVRDLLRARGGELAAVIVEPVAGNMGVVAPLPGFLETLREETARAGCLLVFDEVITGFRVAPGGAQERYGVAADMTCLGKVLGHGMPLGAYGGRREIMETVAPLGPVYQAGTLAGNPLAIAAGLAALNQLRPELYRRLERRSGQLERGLHEAADAADVAVQVPRVGSMMGLFFGPGPVQNYRDAQAMDRRAYGRFFWALLRRGVYLPPAPFESLFVSAAHNQAEIEKTIDAAGAAFREVRTP